MIRLDDPFISYLPRLDLHGYDQNTARGLVNSFLDDCVTLKKSKVIIIHGIGTGVLKDITHDVLRTRHDILGYHLLIDNLGCTLVEIKNINS